MLGRDLPTILTVREDVPGSFGLRGYWRIAARLPAQEQLTRGVQMALIACPECDKEVSDKAPTCPNCGVPLAVPVDALVHVTQKRGKATRFKCQIYVDGAVVAAGRTGDTLRIPCAEPVDIAVRIQGVSYKHQIAPGERWVLRPRPLVGRYFEQVEQIIGF